MIKYDINKVNRLITNYNAKITRLTKKRITGVYIPNKITRQDKIDLLKSVTSKRDLTRRLKELTDYTMRGGEKFTKYKGIDMAYSTMKSIKRYENVLYRQQKQERVNVMYRHATILGKPESITHEQSLDERFLTFRAKEKLRLEGLKTMKVDKYIGRLRMSTKDFEGANFKEKYIEMFIDTAYIAGIPHERVHEMVEKLQSLSEEEFYDLYKQDRVLQNIVFRYKTTNLLGVDEVLNLNADTLYNEVNDLIDSIEDIINYKADIELEQRIEKEAKEYISRHFPNLKETDRYYKTLVFNRRNELRRRYQNKNKK